MTNESIRAAFERMWQHILAALGDKADKVHKHDWSDSGETIAYGDTLTWDGDTDGKMCFAIAEGAAFCKMSDAVLTEDDIANGGILTNKHDELGKLTFQLGSDVVYVDVSDQFGGEVYALVMIPSGQPVVGILPNDIVMADGETYKKGTYFLKAIENGITAHVTSLQINGYNGFPTTEIVTLPNKYLDIVETVGCDTLTWDGDTDGLYSVLDTIYHVSEVIPTLTDLQNGGAIEFSSTATEEQLIFPFTAENVVDGATAGMGTDLIIIVTDSTPIIIATSDKASMTEDGTIIPFGKAGVYFPAVSEDGMIIYTSSFTINGYTGFPKEQVKQEYLPKSQSDNSAYDFIVNITLDGSTAESDKSLDEIIAAVNKGIHPKLKLGTRLVHDYEVGANSDSINFYMCTMQSASLKMYFISIGKVTDGTTKVSYSIY